MPDDDPIRDLNVNTLKGADLLDDLLRAEVKGGPKALHDAINDLAASDAKWALFSVTLTMAGEIKQSAARQVLASGAALN